MALLQLQPKRVQQIFLSLATLSCITLSFFLNTIYVYIALCGSKNEHWTSSLKSRALKYLQLDNQNSCKAKRLDQKTFQGNDFIKKDFITLWN